MKVYPDKKTEMFCKGVFYGGIATAALSVIMAVLSVILGKYTGHAVIRALAYLGFAAGGGLFAYAARIGIRPKFCQFFSYACLAVFIGGCAVAVDFAVLFGNTDPQFAMELILALFIFIIVALSAVFIFALIGADAAKQFYELTRDRMLAIGICGSTAIAGLMAVILSIVSRPEVQAPALWEAIGLFLCMGLAFGCPLALLLGCSRISDPITDKELEQGFRMADSPKPASKDKNDKKDDKKNDKNADRNKPADKNKGKDDRKKGLFGAPGKDGRDKPEDKKDAEDGKKPEAAEAGEKKEEGKKLAFLPKGKKDKDKDRKKGRDDKKQNDEAATDVISTTRKKPVESTNPTDLDAFLRKAEEEEAQGA